MARVVSSIKLFKEKDPHPFKNQVEWYGYPATNTFGQMLDLAIQNNCNIITKNGGGKWYLKNEDYADTLERMNEPDKYNRPRHIYYLIQYEE